MSTAPTVGERLKAERERREMPRVEVTRATGIYVHHVAALEFGRYDEIEDETVVECHVLAYAALLGLDGEALVVDLRRERGLPESVARPAAVPVAADVPVGSRKRVVAWSAGTLTAIVAIAAFWAVTSRRESTPVAVPVPAAPVVPAAEPTRAPPIPPKPPDPVPPPSTRLTVPEHGVGNAVVDHGLVGASDRFPAGATVWFWTRVRGGSAGETVRHVWMHDGREVHVTTLAIGGGDWRTQSSKVVRPGATGEWTVEVRDADGNVLARDSFLATP